MSQTPQFTPEQIEAARTAIVAQEKYWAAQSELEHALGAIMGIDGMQKILECYCTNPSDAVCLELLQELKEKHEENERQWEEETEKDHEKKS